VHLQRSELRISGLLQSAIVAVAVGAKFSGMPADAHAPTWPYFAAGYGMLASTVPWLLGGVSRSEFSLRISALLGIFFALPVGVSAYFLDWSPYRAISVGYWLLVGAWVAHLLTALFLSRKTPTP
jgi:hypothetical protein